MMKLLIADDEEEILLGVKKSIDWASNGILVCGEASNGREALNKIHELSPDILLIDIRMPVLDGLHLIEILNSENNPVKSIILSGYDNFSYAQKALKLGAADYLLKPCMPSEILNTVLKVKALIEKENVKENMYKKLKDQLKENVLQSEEQPELTEFKDKIDSKKITNKIIQLSVIFIQHNYYKDLNLEAIAKEVYITPSYLSLLFKQELNINFVDYLNKVRVEKACKLLKDIRLKVYDIAARVGYNDTKYFCKVFKKNTGVTPSQYRKNL